MSFLFHSSRRLRVAGWIPVLGTSMALAMDRPGMGPERPPFLPVPPWIETKGEDPEGPAFPPEALAAYRADFDDFEGVCAQQLDIERAETFALGEGEEDGKVVEVMVRIGDEMVSVATLNMASPAETSAFRLLYEGGEFAVLEEFSRGDEGKDPLSGMPLRRVEQAWTGAPSRRARMFSAVYFACHGYLPSGEELKKYSGTRGRDLEDEVVTECLHQMRGRLMDAREPAVPFLENVYRLPDPSRPGAWIDAGAFKGFGPRVSAWLIQDPMFKALVLSQTNSLLQAWEESRPAPLPGPCDASGAPRAPEALSDEEALAYAIRMSLGQLEVRSDSPPGPDGAPSGAFEAKEEPFACQDYKDDLTDPALVPPPFLGFAEAGILARDLGLRVPLLGVGPGGQLRVLIHLNKAVAEPPTRTDYHLFFHGNHYSLLEEALEERKDVRVKGIYEIPGGAGPRPMVETGSRPGPGPGVIRPDGNCLISCLYFLAGREHPSPEGMMAIRRKVAEELTEEQILITAGDFLDELAALPVLFENNGRLPGLGPRVSRWLMRNPRIQRALRAGGWTGSASSTWKAGDKRKPDLALSLDEPAEKMRKGSAPEHP